MPATQIQKPLTFKSERIKVHCPQCAVRLCDRKAKEDGWYLHIRYSNKSKVTQIFAKEFFIQCRDCKAWHKITADEGIVESNKNGTGI